MPDILSKEQLLRLSMADMVQSVYMRLTITALCEALDEQEGETRWTDTVLPRLLPYTCGSDGVPRKDFTVGELLKYAGDLMSDKASLPDSLPEGSNPEQFVFATDAHSVPITVPAKSVVSATWKD